MCKGPEVGLGLVCFCNGKETGVARSEWARKRVAADKLR